VNKVILIGRLGADPELRTTQTGKSVCNFSLATNEKSGGEDKTEWHKIVAWEKQADLCNQYLSKGRQVAIEGAIRTRSYEGNDGQTRYSTEINAYRIEFISDGQQRGQQQHPPQQQQGYQQRPPQQPPPQQQGYYRLPQPPPQQQGYGQPPPQQGYQQPPPQQQQQQRPPQQQPPQQQLAYPKGDDIPF
jgi:single-strand DNA-binding protein